MSNIVGIICEYNPFHNGHLYQINKIKEEKPDSKIVAIMSGNTTQRGEFSIFEKYKRAEIALHLGVDLVLELPFPYSSSTAEIFALAGVEIATEIGCDELYFGTENCTLEYLAQLAELIDSEAFEKSLSLELNDKKCSYIVAKERVLSSFGFEKALFANDMLGVEYLRAINKKGKKITPCTIKRVGSGYNDKDISDVMSASAIREYYYNENNLLGVPSEAKTFYDDIIKNNEVLDKNSVIDFIFKYVVLCPIEQIAKAFDSSSEIASIIKSIALESKNGEEFYQKLSTKTYTRARLCRIILYTLFGISKIDKCPKFTILLASNDNGREILNGAKKSNINVITKHSDANELDLSSKSLFENLYEVDRLYYSFLKNDEVPSSAYKKKPIIK